MGVSRSILTTPFPFLMSPSGGSLAWRLSEQTRIDIFSPHLFIAQFMHFSIINNLYFLLANAEEIKWEYADEKQKNVYAACEPLFYPLHFPLS